jgi:diguanylate cyclase (GGDEF)-like protein
VFLAAFLALAIPAAGAWHAQVRGQSEQAFAAQAASVGASVTTAVRRLDDLTLDARTLMAANPNLTNGQFAAWYRSMGIAHRFPGVAGFGYTEVVPNGGLREFARELAGDPIPDATSGLSASPFELLPAGVRPSYCLARLGVTAPGASQTMIELSVSGLDLCALSNVLDVSRDTGRFSAFVLDSTGSPSRFEVIAPVYRGGGVPHTTAARRALIQGWVIGLFDARPTLRTAAAGQHGVAVSLRREHPAVPDTGLPSGVAGTGFRTLLTSIQGSATASYGRVPAGPRLSRRFAVDADGRWVVTVTRAAPTGIASPTAQASVLAAGYIVVVLLVFTLLHVLLRGRARALRMVDEKTTQLRHQALHDSLTGLPNRALIMDRAELLLALARRRRCQPAAMYIDLDGFKGVNDTLGHPVGDELLRAVAMRIAGVLRASDTVGRLAGDEFVVLLEGGPQAAGPEQVAQRILQVLRAPVDAGAPDGPISITASIGVAVGERDAAKDLLRDADIALYEAKAAGRNRYAVFQHEMRIAAHDRVALAMDLRGALDAGELFLVYQPILDLADGRVTGAEALLRWQHPTRGLVPPDEFIALAEDNGLIVEIGAWVLDRACAQAAAWDAAGHLIGVGVNVSARQLDDPSLLGTVERALGASGLDPSRLVIEITETALMQDADAAAALLRELKLLGVRVVIDDFGTGYSSLAYLQQFPVDALKIDRAFVSGSHALVQTVVQLARSLDLRTVAEGIEDESQLSYLREQGCDRGQGYLFAPPLDAPALERFLAAPRPAGLRRCGEIAQGAILPVV